MDCEFNNPSRMDALATWFHRLKWEILKVFKLLKALVNPSIPGESSDPFTFDSH